MLLFSIITAQFSCKTTSGRACCCMTHFSHRNDDCGKEVIVAALWISSTTHFKNDTPVPHLAFILVRAVPRTMTHQEMWFLLFSHLPCRYIFLSLRILYNWRKVYEVKSVDNLLETWSPHWSSPKQHPFYSCLCSADNVWCSSGRATQPQST